jgi:hypothetical protein
MVMPPRVRKFVLTAHVVSSVGWIGAAAAYVVLAVFVLTTPNPQMVRAGVLVMDPTLLLVVYPLGALSLITGTVTSLGTTWGLFRHYWVIFKIAYNLFALVLLTEYTTAVAGMASLVAHPVLSSADVRTLRDPGHLVHSAGAVATLVVATVLAVYKPRGLTRRGQRQQLEQRGRRHERRQGLELKPFQS